MQDNQQELDARTNEVWLGVVAENRIPEVPEPEPPAVEVVKPPLDMSATATAKRIIEEKAVEFGVPVKLALDLATFESGLNPEAANPKSSARGIYQFLTFGKTSTWNLFCEGEVLNPEHNATCAMKLLKERAISHWTSDPLTRNHLLQKGWVACEGEVCKARY